MLVLLATGSCQKTPQAVQEPTDDLESKSKMAMQVSAGPTQVNGWLNFASMKVFESTMQLLHSQFTDPGKLSNWDAQFKGFTSLRKFYELTDADISENRTTPTADSLIKANKLLDCPDSWFATVISKDGYIQIADTVYSFRPGNSKGEAYAVPAKYSRQLIAGTDPKALPGTKTYITSFVRVRMPQWNGYDEFEPVPTPIPGAPSTICEFPSEFMWNWWGQKGDDIFAGDDGSVFPKHNGRQVKLNYHRWRVGYIFYASAGVRLKMWKHTRLAGWQSVTNAEEMTMEACTKGNVIIPGLAWIPFTASTSPAWPGFRVYGENAFEKTLKWTASGLFNEILLDHFNFHFKVNYRSRWVERLIRE